MKSGLAVASLLVARTALACPACASSQRTFNPAYLVMIVLPIVVGIVAIRAILRAMND